MMRLLDHDWEFSTAISASSEIIRIATCRACGMLVRRSVPASEQSPPALPPGCPSRPAPNAASRVWTLLKELPNSVTAVVTAVVGVFGLTFIAFPNVQPVVTRGLTITEVAIQQDVSLEEYWALKPVMRAAETAGDLCETTVAATPVPEDDPVVKHRGSVIDVTWEAVGMRGKCIELSAVLLDGDTRKLLTDLGPIAIFRTDIKESDVASYSIWVDTMQFLGNQSLLVRVEMYDGTKGGVRRAFKESPIFCVQSPCPSPAQPAGGPG